MALNTIKPKDLQKILKGKGITPSKFKQAFKGVNSYHKMSASEVKRKIGELNTSLGGKKRVDFYKINSKIRQLNQENQAREAAARQEELDSTKMEKQDAKNLLIKLREKGSKENHGPDNDTKKRDLRAETLLFEATRNNPPPTRKIEDLPLG
jgi:hypothetical protein